jgi:hypothetical protein
MLHRSLLAFAGAVAVLAACAAGTDPDPGAAEQAANQSDAGRPGAGPDAEAGAARPVDACAALPPRDCTGSFAECSRIVPFEPVTGPGYENYPLNGETDANQYRSHARVDLMMLIKWATAFTACKAAIPGTSVGSPGHPAGTHVNGNDMDIAYYQTGTPNNRLRPICEHVEGGQDQYHCVAAPTRLDLRRTAIFLGALLTSPRVRVIGVDGKVGPLVRPAIQELCDTGVVAAEACTRLGKIVFEETNGGLGWYRFHHHHLHVSLRRLAPPAVPDAGADAGVSPAEDTALVPPEDVDSLDEFLGKAHEVDGHGRAVE